MGKPITHSKAQETARLALMGKYASCGSWRKVEDALGINRGLLCNIANGKRPASDRVLDRLGIAYVRTAPGRVCPEHGVVHDHVHPSRPAWLGEAVAGLRALETARLITIRRK